MPVIQKSESSYSLAPAGSHVARCYACISLGTQASPNPQYKPRFQVVVFFELPNETVTVNGETRPMVVGKFLGTSMGSPNKPSATNLFLTAWRGKPFTPEDIGRFDLANVVGAAAMLNIIHEDKNGKQREVIASISPLPKGMTCPQQFHKSVKYEIEMGKNDVFNALAPGLQKMIAKCLEWNQPAEEAGHDADSDADAGAALADNKKDDEAAG